MEPTSNDMRFAASTVVLGPSGWPSGWEGGLRVLAEAGVESVEFCSELGPDSRDVATFDYTDPYAIERAGAALRDAGLSLHSIHGPISLRPAKEVTEGAEGEVSVSSVPSVAGRHLDALIESLFACIDACAALGGRFVVTQDAIGEVLPSSSLSPGLEGVPHLASRDSLSRLADYAADHGCVFALENGSEDADGFRRIVETVRETIRALGHPGPVGSTISSGHPGPVGSATSSGHPGPVGSATSSGHPGLGICLDLGHAQVWNHSDVPRAVREAGPLLRTCHVHDNLGMSDDHLPPGDGVIPWAAVLGELERAGYRGPPVLELHVGDWLCCERPDSTPRAAPPKLRQRQTGEALIAEAVRRSREFLETVAGPYWQPAISERTGAEGFEVFEATGADRARACCVLPEAVGESGQGWIAVDRFGDVVGWLETGEDGRLRHTFVPGVAEFGDGRALERVRAGLVARRLPVRRQTGDPSCSARTAPEEGR